MIDHVKPYKGFEFTRVVSFDEVTNFFNKRFFAMKKTNDDPMFVADLKVYNDIKMCIYKILIWFDIPGVAFDEEGVDGFKAITKYICEECNMHKRNILVPISIENDPIYMIMQIMVNYIIYTHKTINYNDIYDLRDTFLNILTAIINNEPERCMKLIDEFMDKYFTFENRESVEFCISDDNELMSYVVRPPEFPNFDENNKD